MTGNALTTRQLYELVILHGLCIGQKAETLQHITGLAELARHAAELLARDSGSASGSSAGVESLPTKTKETGVR